MKHRWSLPEIDQVNALVAPDRKKPWARRAFPDSPRGVTSDGFQDYRGFPLGLLVSFDIAEVDFSGAKAARNSYGVKTTIQVEGSRCRSVRFDRSGNLHTLGGVFEDCSFERANASRGGLTGIFRNCRFLQTNLGKSHLIGEFYDCEFVGANLKVASWGGSFSNCRFQDCTIDSIFSELDELVRSDDRVTFSVLTSGRPQIGEVVRQSPHHNLEGLPWVGKAP